MIIPATQANGQAFPWTPSQCSALPATVESAFLGSFETALKKPKRILDSQGTRLTFYHRNTTIPRALIRSRKRILLP